MSAYVSPAFSQTDKPNIIWITIEDTSPQFIGFCGNKYVKTPNIDRLAREGVIFNNAFATGPVSSASRSCLITGVNTSQLGTGNHRSVYPIPEYIKGFPSYIRSKGYFTTNNVKTDYNTSNEKNIVLSSWDKISNDAGWWNRNKNQNFFSVFNYMDSHQSRTMTTPWNWYVEKVLNKLGARDITTPEEIDIPPIYRDTKEMRKDLSRVYNSLNLVDIEIGKLLDSLKRDGLMESSIIFFFSDHGEAIPRGKSSSIGLSYKVPFFIWFPEKFKYLSPWKSGQSTEELINFEDLPPTVLSLAGADIPSYMTGRAILGNQRKKPEPFVFGSRNRIDESPDLVRTATDGRFFYTREFFPSHPSLLYQKYADVSDIVRKIRRDFYDGILNREQSLMLVNREMEYLYDLRNDPWELNNLAETPQWKHKLLELRKANYNRIVKNRDIHFLPEYELQRISEKTTPYDFRNDINFKSKVVIDAAYEATNKAVKAEKLLELLQNKNPFIRYWAIAGFHNHPSYCVIYRDAITPAMNDNYPPVAIEAAAVAWDNFNDQSAKEVIKRYVADRNVMLSLQALQTIMYMKTVPDDMLETVQSLSEKITKSIDGYKSDYNIESSCDMILYRYKNLPLFIPEFKKWMDTEYMVHP